MVEGKKKRLLFSLLYLRAAESSPALSALAAADGATNRGVLLVKGRVEDVLEEDVAAELIAADTLWTADFDKEKAVEAPVEITLAALEEG